MPTVLIIGGWRVVIYPNDHRPAHVHVIGGGCEAVFNLSGEELEPELRENHGFDRGHLRKRKKSYGKPLAWSSFSQTIVFERLQ